MNTRTAFGKSLKQIRKSLKFTQEDFGIVSSRTYLSSLERGLKSPTLDKIEVLAKAMKIHPLTLLTLAYVRMGKERSLEALFQQIRKEIKEIEFKSVN